MDKEEIKNKLESIHNRCTILFYLLNAPVPIEVENAIMTIWEDLAGDVQEVILNNCIEEE